MAKYNSMYGNRKILHFSSPLHSQLAAFSELTSTVISNAVTGYGILDDTTVVILDVLLNVRKDVISNVTEDVTTNVSDDIRDVIHE